MVILTAILLILLESSYEGFKTRSFHVTSEFIEGLFLLCTLPFVFLWLLNVPCPISVHNEDIIKVLFGYLFLRFAIFDGIRNLFAKKELNYIGKTKFWDRKIIQKIADLWGMSTVWFIRFVFGVMAIAFLI